MTQEPWNEEIYETSGASRRGRTEKRAASTTVFTILAVVFVILAIAITAFAVYLSTGGSQTNSSEEFYNTSTSQSSAPASSSVASSSVAESSSTSSTETPPSSSSSEQEVVGETLIVNPGEGEASIAERGHISIAELERLNPEKMTTGSWLAHPGDVVRIK